MRPTHGMGARMSLVDAPMREREVHAYRLLVHDSWGNPLAAAQKSTALFSEKRPPWAHPFMKDADAGAITHGCVGVTGRPPS
jgi:hypothetical protein